MSRSMQVTLFSLSTLAAFAWLAYSVPAETKPAHQQHHAMSQCADACAKCANACGACFQHCLGLLKASKPEHARTAALCNDCSALCSLAAQVESRGGPLNLIICDACAKACDMCAEECGRFADQPHMQACAAACRECARACRDMLQHAGHVR